MRKSSSYRSSRPAYANSYSNEQEQEQSFFSGHQEQPFFQTKMTVGEPNDKFEKEADNVADKVISKKESEEEEPAIQKQEISSIQRLSTPSEDENFSTNDERMRRDREIQEKPDPAPALAPSTGSAPGPSTASSSLSTRIDNSRGHGSSLPSSTLSEMQTSFGADFSKVNIHTDAESVQMNRELGAQAFTHGSDIYFNTGKFDPGSTTGKHLLAHELTHVVQQDNTNTIRTKPKKSKPAPKPAPVFYENETGSLYNDEAKANRVGVKLNGQQYIFANNKGNPTTLDEATVGSVTQRDTNGKPTEASIIRIKQTETSEADEHPGGLHLKQSGDYIGVIYDSAKDTFSDKLMESAGPNLSPIDYDKLPATVKANLHDSSLIALNNGHMWSVMSFHKKDETTDTPRWVPAMSTLRQQTIMGEQGENLPESLKQRITPELTTMGTVSTIEGSFSSTSGGAKTGDPMASLGMFQWGMERNKADKTSSMAKLFKKLKERATEAAKAATPNDEQQLYIDAWDACKAEGMDIDSEGFITLDGKRATGGEVETAMAKVLGGNNDLRTYQLVASDDWIQEFKSHTVWPGPKGDGIFGDHYSYGNDTAYFKPDKHHHITVTPPAATSTVGDYFVSQKAITMAVMLGVNRPNWVPWSVWRALDPSTDAKSKTHDLVQDLVSKWDATKPSKGHDTIDAATAALAGPDVLAAYQALQTFLFPAKKTVPNEEGLIAEFQRQALVLYPVRDINRFHREHRFSTVEGAFHE